MKKLSLREKSLIIVLILIIFFILFYKYLYKIDTVYYKTKNFATKSIAIIFSHLNKEERTALYKNDPLFCLADNDCTTHNKAACPTAINKYYLAENASYYSRVTDPMHITNVFCQPKTLTCENKKCVLKEIK